MEKRGWTHSRAHPRPQEKLSSSVPQFPPVSSLLRCTNNSFAAANLRPHFAPILLQISSLRS